MKYLLIILIILTSCKSSEVARNNKIDKSSELKENIEQNTIVSQIDLNEKEITFLIADPKEETIIIDNNGKQQRFKNIKEVKISTKKEVKKDSIVNNKKEVNKKEQDKSTINETEKVVSDAKNFKNIFLYIAVIVVCLTLIFLIIRFKKGNTQL